MKIIWGLFILLNFCLLVSCKNSKDELAERMSTSENFRIIFEWWQKNSTRFTNLSPATKQSIQTYKKRVKELQKNSNPYQRTDSLINLIKTLPVLSDSFKRSEMILLPNVYRKFNKEFPEYKRFSKPERQQIFKKATDLYLMNKEK